jgi:hypothetical protein
MGISGSGKTTSLRTLDPETTFYLDCDGKGLSWKGWRDQYNTERKNYFRTNYPQLVERWLLWLDGKTRDDSGNVVESKNKDGLKFKVVVIDTLNAIMIGEEQRQMKNKGYDKWADLAGNIWGILELALTLRDDLTVVFMAHTETVSDDNGIVETHISTSGRKLRKMVPESKINTVLLAEIDDAGNHVFTARRQNATAKEGYMGAFPEITMPNDLAEVIKRLEEY